MVPRLNGEIRPAETGAGRLGCLVLLLLLAASVYLGLQVMDGEFAYRSFQSAARQEASLAVDRTDEEIRASLLARVRELELPPRAEEIHIRRDLDRRVVISASYADTVRFLDRWEWVRSRQLRVTTPR